MVFFLFGCITAEQDIYIDENGGVKIIVRFKGDDMEVGEYMPLLRGYLEYLFPEIRTNYKIKSYTAGDLFSEEIIIEFIGNQKMIKNSSMLSIQKVNGKIKFESKVPKFLTEISESQKGKAALKIRIFFPKNIDMANTTEINGNVAVWTLNHEHLLKETSLKAFTK